MLKFNSARRDALGSGIPTITTMHKANKVVEKRGKTEDKIGVIADRPYYFVYVSLVSRAIHQLAAAIFLATYILGGNNAQAWRISLMIAAVSGFVLLGAEAIRHRQFLREVFGLTTLFKVILIGLAHHGWLAEIPSVTIAFLLASLVSHAPKAVRHRLII